MKKMTPAAQVKMNASLIAAASLPLKRVQGYDLTQASEPALRAGVASIDVSGYFRVRLEDPRTADEEKRILIADEIRRRGGVVS